METKEWSSIIMIYEYRVPLVGYLSIKIKEGEWVYSGITLFSYVDKNSIYSQKSTSKGIVLAILIIRSFILTARIIKIEVEEEKLVLFDRELLNPPILPFN